MNRENTKRAGEKKPLSVKLTAKALRLIARDIFTAQIDLMTHGILAVVSYRMNAVAILLESAQAPKNEQSPPPCGLFAVLTFSVK
jgi:hypothetical protein